MHKIVILIYLGKVISKTYSVWLITNMDFTWIIEMYLGDR